MSFISSYALDAFALMVSLSFIRWPHLTVHNVRVPSIGRSVFAFFSFPPLILLLAGQLICSDNIYYSSWIEAFFALRTANTTIIVVIVLVFMKTIYASLRRLDSLESSQSISKESTSKSNRRRKICNNIDILLCCSGQFARPAFDFSF